MHYKPILLLTFCLLFSSAFSQSLTVLTYNIRYDNPGDGLNGWNNRRDWLCEQIKTAHPVIFGIQEGLIRQVHYLDSCLKDYGHIGVGRDDGKEKGEFSAIFYEKSKIQPIVQGTFWLSPTPGSVSTGWDAALERICTYGLFREMASGKMFWMFNTHFDHMGVQARKNSAILILQKIKELNKKQFPLILCGDFNADAESEPIGILKTVLQDSKTAEKSSQAKSGGTFNDFEPSKPATERIDFIFTGFGAKANSYSLINEIRNGSYASDHFAVISTIELKKQ